MTETVLVTEEEYRALYRINRELKRDLEKALKENERLKIIVIGACSPRPLPEKK